MSKDCIFTDMHTCTVLAEKESGKTILIASEANKLDSFVVVDVLGVLDKEKRYRSGHIPRSNYHRADRNSEGDAVDMFIQWEPHTTLKRHVIDFSDFVTKEEAVEAMEKLSAYLLMIAKNGRPYPVFIDEVQEVCPQLERAGHHTLKLFKTGRNYGIRPIVAATQRPESTDKEIIEVAHAFLIGGEKGLNTVEKVGKIAGVDIEVFKKMPRRSFYNTATNKIFTNPNYRYANKQ